METNASSTSNTSYLSVAEQGKNDWWRYLLGYGFIIGFWLLIGSIPIIILAIFVELDGSPTTLIDPATGGVSGYPLLYFISLLLSFVPLFIAVPVVVRFFHGRPMRTLISASPRIRWGRVFVAMLAWGILACLVALVESLLYPERYAFTFNAAEIAPFVLFGLLLLPIQTSAEEFLMRGYLIQNAGLKIKNIWVLSILSGLLFTLPHMWNPEVSVDAVLLPLFYFSFGFFAAFVTVKDGGMELALGLHAANNLFALLVNYTGSALPNPSVFTVNVIDPVYGLVAPILAMLIFYFIFFRPKRTAE